MHEAPPHGAQVDILVVGGLTIDELPDGSRAAGGSVLHAARAVHAMGLRVGVVTVTGDEPVALEGLRELERLAVVERQIARATIAFRHRVRGGRRKLFMLDGGSPLLAPRRSFRPAAVLYAPVAAELGADLARLRYPDALPGAILQGWLRALGGGRLVTTVALRALPMALVDRLAELRLLVASVEDLAAEHAAPAALGGRLRVLVGPAPAIAITDGERGAWLDEADRRLLVAPPRIIRGRLATGAGDAFAAVLLALLARGVDVERAAREAAAAAADYIAAPPR